MNDTINAKPWWQSKTVLGVIVMAVSGLAAQTGAAEITAADQAAIVDWLLAAVGVGGAGFAIWGRIVARQRIG